MRIGNLKLEFPRRDLQATELLLKLLGPFKTRTTMTTTAHLLSTYADEDQTRFGRDTVGASVVHIFNVSDDSRPIATWNFGLVSTLEL